MQRRTSLHNLASGNTLKVLFGKIKNWFGRLKALAFKDKIKNADVDSAAAIEYAKLSGVAPESHSHDDRYYTESEINTKLNAKQDTLSWDDTPTSGSSKPVKSGGVYTELNKKVTASGGEIGDTKVTFSDATGTRSNISSGDTTKSLFGKIKQWFAALGTLAFKSSITNSDVSSSAAIDKSKISGLGSLAAKNSISNADVATNADIEIGKLKLSSIRNLLYPIGSIKMSTENTNPSTYLGGTWVAWGSGKVPVGVDSLDSDFSTVEKSGGEKTHKLTIDEIPSHTHTFQATPFSDMGGQTYKILSSVDATGMSTVG